MPRDGLVEALERVRNVYVQRQRSATTVLTALKNSTSILSKASKSLKDYADLQTDHPSAVVDQAQQAMSGLRLKDEVVDPLLPELRREVKMLSRIVGAIKDAQTAVRGEAVDVIRLGRAIPVLQAEQSGAPELSALLGELQSEYEQAQRELGNTFGAALRDAAVAKGLKLGGRPPRFSIGRFEIEANWTKRIAALRYGTEPVAPRVPLSVEAVLEAYQRERASIMDRNEEGSRWIEQFYQAWDLARYKRGGNDQRANIVDCYYELVLLRQGKNFRIAPGKHTIVDYTRAQFAYDFFEFAHRRRLAFRDLRAFGHGATKSHAGNPERSFWIVEGDGPSDGRYIADVVFSKDE